MRKNGEGRIEKIDRESLLRQLHIASPGLSRRATVDQSDCFIFSDKKISTFNDQIACRCYTEIDFECAVPAAPLLSALENIVDSQITITLKNGKFTVLGKNTRTRISIPEDITLPVDCIPEVIDWEELPDDFQTGLALVQPCASSNVSEFIGTCIHFAPKRMEACDGFVMGRYAMRLPVEEGILLLKESLQHLLREETTHFHEDEQWAHFKTASGLQLSCRRYLDEYPALDNHFKSEGRVLPLEKAMASAAERAALFLDDIKEGVIQVNVHKNKVEIIGEGTMTTHTTRARIKYDGKPLSFLIPPEVLIRLANEYSRFTVGQYKINASNKPFQFCATLAEEAR